MKKILITGASGFLGWHLCHSLKDQYQLEGLYYRQNFELEGLNWHRFNLLEEKKLPTLIAKIQPDLIVHLAAIANTNFCEENPALAHHVNVYSTIALAEASEKLGIPLLFSSTDLVFNGNAGPYEEDDFPYPLSVYGTQKLAAEEALLSDFKHTMVVRLPLLFGFGPDYSKNFFKQWIQALGEKEEIMAFTDEYRNPLSAWEASRGLQLAIEYLDKNWAEQQLEIRLLHLGGKETLSRHEFAQLISSCFQLDDSLILPKLRADLPMAAARPENVALDTILADKILGFKAEAILSQIEKLKKELS